MGPLLLNTDVLECYARLLAEVAAQLHGAAASASASAATRSERHEGTQRQPSEPGQQVPRPTAQQVDVQVLYGLLCEIIRVVQPLYATVPSEGSDSPTPEAGAEQNVPDGVRTQLQSSWLLEHWARVLLLATAPTLAGSNRQQQKIQTMQTDMFQRLCEMHDWMRLDLVDFVRRPWGCSLAFIHIARLCAALDGAEVYGLPRHDVFVLRPAAFTDTERFVKSHPAARHIDARDLQLGPACSLLPALLILRAWTSLLAEAFPDRPAAKAATGPAAAGGPAAAHMGRVAEQGQAQVGAGAGSGEEEGVQQTEGAARRSYLPPLNRGATADLCLRLATGLLANWGAVIPGVRVGGTNVAGAGQGGRFPKASASAALRFTLACARMALLPDVWGRARVRGRTHARLRAWWETYLAAAQHPEALRLVMIRSATYPIWTDCSPGLSLQPSADAAAALEAGLLTCLSQLASLSAESGVGRGALWCWFDYLPGVVPCWPDLLLFGPLGQVAELASGLGRRLRLAVEQLLAAVVAAAGAAAEHHGGRSLTRVTCEAHDALYSADRMNEMLTGMLFRSQLARSEADGAMVADMAARVSVVAAELLPALSQGVRACAELVQLVGLGDVEGPEQVQERAGGEAAEALMEAARATARNELRPVIKESASYASSALCWVGLLLARHCLEAAGEHQGGQGGPPVAAGGGGGDGGVETPWRQLLLRDVRLMELLGAAAELRSAGRTLSLWREMSKSLAASVFVAAAAFPAEFRAAVQGGAEGAAEEGGSGGGPAGSTRSMAWDAALEALEGLWMRSDGQLGLVVRVLRGWDPSPQEAWSAVRGVVGSGFGGVSEETVLELLRSMLPPAAARAAAAAAAKEAATAAAAPAPGDAAGTAAAGAATAGG